MTLRSPLALAAGLALAALPVAGRAQSTPPPLPQSEPPPLPQSLPELSFYVDQNGTRGGPFGAEALAAMARSGALTPSTLVWTKGMPNWQPAGDVAALRPVMGGAGQMPPPIPQPGPTPGGTANFPPPGGKPAPLPTPFPAPQPGGGPVAQQPQVPAPRPPAPGPNTPGQNTPGPNAPGQANPQLEQLAAKELEDFGIPPTAQLHTGAMHAPTPSSIPGGKVITTAQLMQLVQSGQPYMLFDALGGERALPGAINAVQAASAEGGFSGQIEAQMSNYLQRATGGNRAVPLVFYCLSTHCWMSYNASLRAIHLGYTNVLWYRGGVEAWESVGLPTVQPQQ